jgi:hypothetical protein
MKNFYCKTAAFFETLSAAIQLLADLSGYIFLALFALVVLIAILVFGWGLGT